MSCHVPTSQQNGMKDEDLTYTNHGGSADNSTRFCPVVTEARNSSSTLLSPAQSQRLQSLVEYHEMLNTASAIGPVAMPTSDTQTPRDPPLSSVSLPTSDASPTTTGVITNNVCQICHKDFPRWEQLKRHLITHTDFRPYDCKVCGKRFQSQNKMQRHELTHSGIKPFQCPLCAVKVSRKEHLRRHMLVHSEAKPYKCSMCDHTARRLDSMQGHVKQKHGGGTASVVSLFKQPGYQDGLEALTRTLEQSIQGSPVDTSLPHAEPIMNSKASKKKGSKKRKRSNPTQIENCTQTEQKQGACTIPDQSTSNEELAERANTSVFPEFMPDGTLNKQQLHKIEQGQNNTGKLTHSSDKTPDKGTQNSTEESSIQNYYVKQENIGTSFTVKTEPGTNDLSQMQWQQGQGQGQGQQQGFMSANTAYPAQLFVNPSLYPAQPQLLPGNQPSHWPEQQTRFATPLFAAAVCQPAAQSGAVAMQSPYFNPPAGFCPYPGVAVNQGSNTVPSSSFAGHDVPDFFKKRIKQSTQELNKMAQELSPDKQCS